ncbi:MAG: aspartate aminotransferase family protein [Actinobacteria bacterium]|nr:aspartate aminotransferase family protein [Actinomycetota bacterium]
MGSTVKKDKNLNNLNDFKTNTGIYEEGMKYLMNTYTRQPVVFEKAKMQYLWDIEGNKYTDFTSGYGCLNVGHTNNEIVAAIKKQVSKIIQPSNIYFSQSQVMLAKKLSELTGFDGKIFFANSGAEAIEGAIKLARKYSTDKYNKQRYEIISFQNSFHGRTFGALSATAQAQKQKLFEPLLQGFRYALFNDLDSVSGSINTNTCAILIELIQGEGGINVSDKDFIKSLEKICKEKDILLIIDEIQTGLAYENYDIVPDILVLAKSLGGGMPIGAIIARDEINKAFTPGTHGSTFGGNAASCAAGVAVLNYFEKYELIRKSQETGKYLLSKLNKLKEKYAGAVKEVRGMGLMLAIEFKSPIAGEIIVSGLKDRLVLNKVSDFTIRFLPSLVINKKDINNLITFLDKKLKESDDSGKDKKN